MKIYYVMLQSRMIGDAAYESLWYESNPNQNQDVLLMIIRSQKHLTLTVGKFVDLSLQQFTNVRILPDKIGFKNLDILIFIHMIVIVYAYALIIM